MDRTSSSISAIGVFFLRSYEFADGSLIIHGEEKLKKPPRPLNYLMDFSDKQSVNLIEFTGKVYGVKTVF